MGGTLGGRSDARRRCWTLGVQRAATGACEIVASFFNAAFSAGVSCAAGPRHWPTAARGFPYSADVQTTEISGVTTFWEQGPDPLTGMLMFRVGARHETFRTAEVCHLVEHLVMSTMPKSHVDTNAKVDIDTTTFHATGKPEAVADFLRRVCAALTNLPMDRLELEAGVLNAEDGSPAHPAVCSSIGARYGFSGVGLVNATGPGPSRITAEQVTDFAARHFVRDNAMLVLTGPPPAGLQLDLPDGTPPPVPASHRSSLPLPAVLKGDVPYAVLSMELPGEVQQRSMLQGVLRERITDDLRHTRGIAYDCEVDLVRLDDVTLLTSWTDGHKDKRADIAAGLWSAVRDLAEQGPTPAELNHQLASAEAAMDDPRNVADWLAGQAWLHLNGHPTRTRQEQLAALQAVTPETVQGWVKQALPSAFMGLPEDVDVDLPGLPDRTREERPPGTEATGETFGRKALCIAPLDLRVVAGADGISQRAQGYTISASWGDVVGVASADGVREIVLSTGQRMLLSRRHLRNIDRLLVIVDEKTADRAFDSTEDEILAS